MKSVTEEDAVAFCKLCHWAYDGWIIHRILFDDIQDRLMCLGALDDFIDTGGGNCFFHVAAVSHEYLLLQIAKLHDPTRRGQRLSIGFFRNQKTWGPTEKERVAKIVQGLDEFYQFIKPARDKVIAHNDRLAMQSSRFLGEYPSKMDERYFLQLGRLCEMIWNKWGPRDGPYDKNRVFCFGPEGIPDDPLCPSTGSRQLANVVTAHPFLWVGLA